MFWITLAFVIDQITKYIATNYWRFNPKKVLFFYFTYATNKGVAFGLFSNSKEIVVYLTLAITIFLSIIPLVKRLDFLTNMFLGFIIGGALGNVVDRIRFGYVVDFVTMPYWPTIYNLADFFILLGGIGIAIISLRRRDVGNSSNSTGEGLEIRQIYSRKSTRLDIENVHSKSDQEWNGNSK
ncbi:signal peptidase II [Thermosipho melanesiensis]|uniref:Lipoprotein signal peptidase n=2 Tax=Thermosipho melanesiensis TaxID=46541 RepID=A6LLP8_THEM4|nr:signal peptidase II [Thermosipho melanesiensis]ABR30849.1 peptidase A8, signal peptidase II [Thermosipho melanesiensis BI429]APT73968.1 signal peptidase [Thermosipho melanesiensis]